MERELAPAASPRKRKLRVGVFADAPLQPRWVVEALAKLAAADFAEVRLIDAGRNSREAPSLAWRLYGALDRRLFGSAPTDPVLLAEQLEPGAPDAPLDIAFALGALEDARLEGRARYGVWRFCFGADGAAGESLAGLPEVASAEPLSASGLKVRLAAGRPARLAYQSWSRTYPFSVVRNSDQLLRKTAGGRPVVPFAAAFLIYFREGIEAALLVGALLAGLRRLGRPEAGRYLHAGWIAAIPAGLMTWYAADHLISVGAEQQEVIEAGVALLAAAVLFSVSFWLISKAESRHWAEYLKRSLAAGLGGRSLLVLSGLAFLAVYREAAETVLFTQALLLESAPHHGQVWAGAASGLLGVGVAAYLMAGTVRRLPLGPFFAVSGALLCGLAISFAGSGLYALVAAGYIPPRPVPFPEIPWLGIHPDLTALLVQLSIVTLVACAGLASLRRKPAAAAAVVAEPARRNP